MQATITHKGILYADEISLLLGIKKAKVYSWLKKYWQDRQVGPNAVDFYSFIEIYVFLKLREKMSMQSIQRAYKLLKQTFKTEFPFANRNFYFYGKDLIVKKQDDLVSFADNPLQLYIDDFVADYLEKIDFDKDLPTCFYPQGKNGVIISNPDILSGEPVIKGTRISIYTIQSMLIAGDDIKTIAYAYEIPENTILEIQNFFEKAV